MIDEELAKRDAEIERLRRWVDDLQSGMYVNCVYCGHRYGPGDTTPVSMADALKAHVERCPRHPMAELRSAVIDIHNDFDRAEADRQPASVRRAWELGLRYWEGIAD